MPQSSPWERALDEPSLEQQGENEQIRQLSLDFAKMCRSYPGNPSMYVVMRATIRFLQSLAMATDAPKEATLRLSLTLALNPFIKE
jgi:hypothetical protein